MPKVKFLTAAAWQGRHIRRNDVVEMDAKTAEAYCSNGQAELVAENQAEKPAAETAKRPASPPSRNRRKAAEPDESDE